MRVFISHSSIDAEDARRICSLIEKKGDTCFLAPRDIRSGHEYAEEIINGIDSCQVMLLLLSQPANDSPHVLREIERAVSKKIPIVVYKLEDVTLSKSMEYFLMAHQWISSTPRADTSEILKCINELRPGSAEAACPAPATAPVTEVSLSEANKTDRKGSVLPLALKIAIPVAAVAVICLLIWLIGFSHAEQPQSSSDITSISDSSGENTSLTESVVTSESEHSSEAELSSDMYETSSQPETTPLTSEKESSLPYSSETEDVATQPDTAPSSPEQTTADTSYTTSAPNVQEEPTAPLAELGDKVVLGTYNGKPIEWRVIQLSENGTQAMVIADRIITMKAFDAAEGGKYNTLDGESYWNVPAGELSSEQQILARGNNSWELSNLRTWLNSDKENVSYNDYAPTAKAMSELKNGYNTEAGFLTNFTKKELDAVLTTSVKTGETITQDRVFLLSTNELDLLFDADVRKYAYPTDEAVAQDQSGWYTMYVNDFGTLDHYWWLRDANSDTACEVYVVANSLWGTNTVSESAGLEGYGVRPVMTIDLTAPSIEIR